MKRNYKFLLLYSIFIPMLSHLIIEIFFYSFDLKRVLEQIVFNRPGIFILGACMLFIFYILISSIMGSFILGGLNLVFLSFLLGISTYLKNVHRGEPIYPNEIYWVKELFFLLEIIGSKALFLILFALCIFILINIFIYKKYIFSKKELKEKVSVKYRFSLATISLILIIYTTKFNYEGNIVKKVYSSSADWITWSQTENYNNNGFIAGFLYNLDAPPMEKPENYSETEIKRIFNKYDKISKELNNTVKNTDKDTNIIFIMNESFSDPLSLEALTTNKDPLPFYRENLQKTMRGTLLVPGYGGGTATNEFQVLTGVSLEPLSPQITSPFIQMTNRMDKLPSIAKKLKNIGYKSTAIHPFSPSSYRRRDVYEYLGFDDFYHQENMKNTNRLNELHPYISDQSVYKELFEIMDNTEETDFMHIVTMQNHSGYRDQYDEIEFEVSGTGDYGSAIGYFQDLYESDKALADLINKIDEHDEPIILLFWGDHLPGFYKDGVIANNSNITMHETPFFIYSNFIELDIDVGMKSLVYLSGYVLQLLDYNFSPYDALLYSLENKLDIVDDRLYIEEASEDNIYFRDELSSESQEILEEYSLILYDITTGNNYLNEFNFFGY